MNLRVQNVLENLKEAGSWRPKDYANFVSLLLQMPKPPKTRNLPPLNPAQVALTMLTQMRISYTPSESTPHAASNDVQRATAHLAEPTVALFVDAPEHLSGVSLTLKSWADEAKKQGLPFFLHLAGVETGIPGAKTFPNIGTLHLNSYQGLEVPVPDVKAVNDYMKGHPFDVAHLSTPGPMGLFGMKVAQSLGAPICGTYHTDFPRYVRDLTGSADLEAYTWDYMRWFYGQMDLVAAPSSTTKDDLVAHGLDASRIQVVGRGVETDLFCPGKRSESLRAAWGAEDKPVLLYVGRISKEKNLPLLAEAFRTMQKEAVLVIVGDGPYRKEMKQELRDTDCVFTGALHGEELYTAFASGDLFVFPSETDTFGRVLIEAQASGLPALVSDQGGPRDTIAPEQTGRMVASVTPFNFAEAMDDLVTDRDRLRRWGQQARKHALTFTPEASFNAFWNLHRTALTLQEDSHGN